VFVPLKIIMNVKWLKFLSLLAVLGYCTVLVPPLICARAVVLDKQQSSKPIKVVVDMGIFNLDRQYLAMQGPGITKNLRISSLMALRTTTAVAKSPHELQLYWLKGFQVNAFDENGKAAEQYLCHLNVDADLSMHRKYFPSSTLSHYRVAILGQGTTKIMLSTGLGIPFADCEKLRISASLVNTHAAIHRCVKLRVSLYFLPDGKSTVHMAALAWEPLSLRVAAKSDVGGKDNLTCCEERASAYEAPNSWRRHANCPLKDSNGRILSNHWLVPPGTHTYYSPVDAEWNHDFSQHGPVKLVLFHVHPFCKSVSLVELLDNKRKTLFTAHSKTAMMLEPEVEHTDVLVFSRGIALNKAAKYRIESVYNNTSTQPIDAMVNACVFFLDLKFKRPNWAND
jgi:hypothetical protein